MSSENPSTFVSVKPLDISDDKSVHYQPSLYQQNQVSQLGPCQERKQQPRAKSHANLGPGRREM